MISEPMTLATDYLLALAAAVIAASVLRTAGGQDARRWWGVAFIALALGAALGGTHHGFRLEALWKPTVLVLGVNAVVNAIERRALHWRPVERDMKL